MQHWARGYVSDLTYTHGFYRELSPSFLSFAALLSGHNAPDTNKGVNYCELGCGQGYTMNVIAAANPQSRFFATDFNPAQINHAKTIAIIGNIDNINFFDDVFEQVIVNIQQI